MDSGVSSRARVRRAVLTSDHHAWLLGAFFHQWSRYDARPIEVVGFSRPDHALLAGHPFVSLGRFEDYPARRWSDGVIRYLEGVTEELVELWLEDYWLIRRSNLTMIADAAEYMAAHPDILRFDLSTDRLYAAGAVDIGAVGCMDIIEAKGEYSLSFQASIFRRTALLEVLAAGESPWQTEINGTTRVNQSDWRVVGSRQGLVRYLIAVNKGKLDRSGAWMFPRRTLNAFDWGELDRLGLTSPGQGARLS